MRKIFSSWLFLAFALVSLAVLIGSGGSSQDSSESAPKPERSVFKNISGKPNVLFILTDDQPSDTLRVMPKTMAWFKKRGVVFPNHFVATPVCCPSRASFMTGQYGHNNGVLNNRSAERFQYQDYIYDRQRKRRIWVDQFVFKRSLTCDLYQAGYTTALFGKYVNGWQNKSTKNERGNIPSCFGPDSWIGFDENNIGSTQSDYRDRPISVPDSTPFLTEKANQFIEKQAAGQPWFTYLSLHAPHLPIEEDGEYGDWYPEKPYRPSLAEKTLVGNKTKPNYISKAAKYYQKSPSSSTERFSLGQERMVKEIDDAFASTLKTLKETGQLNNTVIVFSSDNGFLWGDHGLYSKFYPYLDSVRTPLMISYPKKITKPKTDNRLVSNVDFAPTIYSLTGIKPDHTVDGYSVFSNYKRNHLLTESGGNGKTPYWAALITNKYHYIETFGNENGVSDKEWRLIERDPFLILPDSKKDVSFRELYYLKNADGEEVFNKYKTNKNIAKKLAKTLHKAAWKSDPSKTKQKGCYGTIFSDSKNPCR
jgi:arylsulfatase A-like enzyme